MFHLLPDSKTEFLPPISSLYLVTAIRAADTSTTQARIVLSTCGLIQLLYRIELSVMLELDFWKIVSKIEKLSRVGCISLFVWLTISNASVSPFETSSALPIFECWHCLSAWKKKKKNDTSSWDIMVQMHFSQSLLACSILDGVPSSPLSVL